MSLVTALVRSVDGGGQRRTMAVACGAHALHDGFTDLLYVLLPLWQAEFGLGYAEIGILRALYAGSMAGFRSPLVSSPSVSAALRCWRPAPRSPASAIWSPAPARVLRC